MMGLTRLTILNLALLLCPIARAQITYQESRNASIIIGKWLSKSTGHYDFYSATSVATKRAGKKFFGIPDLQMASEFGVSQMQAPRDEDVTKAYEVIGADTSNMSNSLSLTRFHVNLGFANQHDFTFSYLTSPIDQIKGWGLGYKHVLAHQGYGYLSYRLHYARAERDNYFTSNSYTNDLAVSLYLRLVDIYVGFRHWSGKVDFNSTVPELKLPEVNYFSTASEIEHYYGIILALTTNSRFTMEANSLGKQKSIIGKLSFHFDSLVPTTDSGWFRDPRYIKQ
jgi:hypothetical protein